METFKANSSINSNGGKEGLIFAVLDRNDESRA